MTESDGSAQRTTLIIGLAIPVLMVGLVAAAIFLPRLLANVEPAGFDFLYSMGQHDPRFHYLVSKNRLVREPRGIVDNESPSPMDRYFFVHDVASNQSHEITFAEARKLYLEGRAIAPDGYRVESGHRSGWFPFDGHHDYRRRFLVKDHFSQELNLQLDDSENYHYQSYRFHGWIRSEP